MGQDSSNHSAPAPHPQRVVAGWILGAGLAVLAMAFPQERLIGEPQWEAGWLPAFVVPLLEQFGGLGSSLARRGPEALAFVLSALAFGACLPVMLSIARRSQLPFRPALAASAIVLLSPVGWLAGTLPGNGSLALLFALLALRSLWGPRAGRDAWALALWAVAAYVSPVFLWLLPAVAGGVALRSEGSGRRLLRGVTACLLGVGAYLALLVFLYGAKGCLTVFDLLVGEPLTWLVWDDALGELTRQALFGGSGGWGQLLAWIAGLIPGLGLGALAVGSLFLLRRRMEEGPPPRWLLVWCLLPLIAVSLGGSPTWDVPYLWLLAPAFIGGVDLLARLDEKPGLPLAVAALALQIAILFGALAVVRSTDPLAQWRAAAAETLREGDVVFTARSDHAYLLAHRWRIETVSLEDYLTRPEQLDDSRPDWPVVYATDWASSGHRVVFDTDAPEGLRDQIEELIARVEAMTPVVRLDPRE